MTDNEIIKALECCGGSNCHECPIEGCTDDIFGNALDLINRQKAEIEAYKECIAKVKNYIKTHCNPYSKPDFDYDTSIKILNFIDSFAQEM